MKAYGKHQTHSVEFKRQVSQDYLGGETLHALSKCYDVSRDLIRIWVEKYQAGALDEVPQRLIFSMLMRRASPRSTTGRQADPGA